MGVALTPLTPKVTKMAKAKVVNPKVAAPVAATTPALAIQALPGVTNPARAGSKRQAWLACVLAAKATKALASTWASMQAAGQVPTGCAPCTMAHVNWAVRAKLVRTMPIGKV